MLLSRRGRGQLETCLDPKTMAKTRSGVTASGKNCITAATDKPTYPDPFRKYRKEIQNDGCTVDVSSSRLSSNKQTNRTLLALPLIKDHSRSGVTHKGRHSSSGSPSRDKYRSYAMPKTVDYSRNVYSQSLVTSSGHRKSKLKDKDNNPRKSYSGSPNHVRVLNGDVKRRQFNSTPVNFVTADVRKPTEVKLKSEPCTILRLLLSTPEVYNTPELVSTDRQTDSRSTPGLQDDVISVCTIHLDKLDSHVVTSSYPEHTDCHPWDEDRAAGKPGDVLRDSLTAVPLSNDVISGQDVIDSDVQSTKVVTSVTKAVMRHNDNPEGPGIKAQNPEIKKLGVLLKRGVAELNKNWKVFRQQQQRQQQEVEEDDLDQLQEEEQKQKQQQDELKQQHDESFALLKQIAQNNIRQRDEKMINNYKDDKTIDLSDLQWEFINECISKRQSTLQNAHLDDILRSKQEISDSYQKSGFKISKGSTENVSQTIDPENNSSRNVPETTPKPDTVVDDVYPEGCRSGEPTAGQASTGIKHSEQKPSKQRGHVKSRARKRMVTAQKARANGLRNIWISEQKCNNNWRRSRTGMFGVL